MMRIYITINNCQYKTWFGRVVGLDKIRRYNTGHHVEYASSFYWLRLKFLRDLTKVDDLRMRKNRCPLQ